MEGCPRIEPLTRVAEFDLHGLSLLTAGEMAEVWVREARDHGCTAVRFIHGLRFRSYDEAGAEATIKSLLWQKLRRGDFRAFAQDARSPEHRREGASLLVALRANLDADPHGPWTRPPLPEYD